MTSIYVRTGRNRIHLEQMSRDEFKTQQRPKVCMNSWKKRRQESVFGQLSPLFTGDLREVHPHTYRISRQVDMQVGAAQTLLARALQ